jgi:FkbM family methyltransferase
MSNIAKKLKSKNLDISISHLNFSYDRAIDVWKGAYSDTLKRMAQSETIHTFLDLGANVGATINFFCETFPSINTVYGFEPMPFNYDYLMYKIAPLLSENKKIQIFQKAVYYGIQKASFCGLGDNNTGGMHLSEIVESNNAEFGWGEAFLIGYDAECVTLEDTLPSSTIIDLCKIDIEGSEWNVLSNSQFIKNNIKNILLEYHFVSNDGIVRRRNPLSGPCLRYNNAEAYAIKFINDHLPNFSIVETILSSEGIWIRNNNL